MPFCLDEDISLMPVSCLPANSSSASRARDSSSASRNTSTRDEDDFSFWSEKQAKRICGAIEQAFGVEYATDVVVADANLTALARRILASKELEA